ncbi:hypothetical protein [Klebsiella pneumoniae]|uniref:hypothetical protein n=1 Tax=Klebsiella pneumoniae TaxID=573 RepID=UPI001D0F0394|nr:hypothetical protein [Klebsiella pneumoniae]
MMIQILKACAGPVTERKPAVSASNDINSHLVSGAVDESWPGFIARTMIDYEATGINDNDTWMGPFLACPENEKIDAFEVNFSFPSGICGFNKKGKKEAWWVGWVIQYRIYGSGGDGKRATDFTS